MCASGDVRVCDDDGVELNEEFSVEADGPYLSVVLESAGGKTAVAYGHVTTSTSRR